MIEVSQLFIYPIKSCAGVRVDSAEITPTGFAHDRLLLVTDPAGNMLTQRTHPRMCWIQPTIEGDQLTLAAPEQSQISLTINRVGESSPVTVWRDLCLAVDQGDTVAAWLSNYLKTEVRLMAMAADHQRHVDPLFARTPSDVTSFSDAYAFLLISEASLALLNSKLERAVEMVRFRPNIVIKNSTPHAEDYLGTIEIGSVTFSGVKPCSRCAIPTIDLATAKIGKEPSKTLNTYRNFGGKILFGNNLIHHELGTIKLGDQVTLGEIA